MKSFILRACVLGSLLGLAALPQQAAHAQVTQTFSYTGGYQSFLVPPGVRRLTVKLWGAGGGWAGGSGAFVTGNLAVTPGATLTLLVGGGGVFGNSSAFGGGGAGRNGGGGGGRSAIRLSVDNAIVSDELVTAAGGGGARLASSGVGGGGGLSTGQNGTGNGPGGGATQTHGGAGGAFLGFSGQEGSQFLGGDVGASGAGGGGGGGYFGGGGGNASSGGGGGSSYTTYRDFSFNSAASRAGAQGSASGVLPGGASDPSYLTGIGVGGGDRSSGGNGYIVISYIAVPEPGSLALLALGAGAFLIARRRRDT